MKKRNYREKRMLNVPLTDQERLEFGEALAHSQNAVNEAEAQKKVAVGQLGADIKQKSAERDRLAAIVNGKSKTIEVECIWQLNLPKRGRKVLVRQDTKVIVDERDMDEHDKQELFPDEVADLEKPSGDAGAVEVSGQLLGLPEKSSVPKEKKGKKPKAEKPGETDDAANIDWPAVRAAYIKRRRGVLPKAAMSATAEEFKINVNTLKARVKREKWNDEAAKAD